MVEQRFFQRLQLLVEEILHLHSQPVACPTCVESLYSSEPRCRLSSTKKNPIDAYSNPFNLPLISSFRAYSDTNLLVSSAFKFRLASRSKSHCVYALHALPSELPRDSRCTAA